MPSSATRLETDGLSSELSSQASGRELVILPSGWIIRANPGEGWFIVPFLADSVSPAGAGHLVGSVVATGVAYLTESYYEIRVDPQ